MSRITTLVFLSALSAASLIGDERPASRGNRPAGLISREPPPGAIPLPRGTRVPLVLINSVSTKNAAPGDKLYLESVYPVAIDGRIFLPPGTYVTGRVTEVKRPGRIKGRGELRVLFEQMILPNGTIRNFVGSLGSLDGAAEETLDRERGRVQGPGSKGEDAAAVADAARTGATIGVIAGAAGGSPGQGLGLGAAGGAAAGMAGVLLSRGPEAVLERGTQLDMILDRDLFFTEEELNFKDSVRPPAATPIRSAPPQAQGRERRQGGVLGLPF